MKPFLTSPPKQGKQGGGGGDDDKLGSFFGEKPIDAVSKLI